MKIKFFDLFMYMDYFQPKISFSIGGGTEKTTGSSTTDRTVEEEAVKTVEEESVQKKCELQSL